MSFFGETDSIPNEIKKLHREIDTLRNKSEFQPILTTGRSDDGFGASAGSKTMNSGGVWSLTPVTYKLIDNPATAGESFDMLELISACAVIEDIDPDDDSNTTTTLELKTINMGSAKVSADFPAGDIKNTTPNGALLFLKPISGKTLTLKTGGNIHIDNDIAINEKGFAILQFYVSGTTGGTDEQNKKWLVLSGGSSTINSIKEPCRCATTGNNLVPTAIGTTIDGVTIVAGNRVLYKNQSTTRDNGIYVCTLVVGIVATMERASDFNQDAEVKAGTIVTVNEGTANGNKLFMMTEDVDPIIVGTSAINFTLVTSVDTGLDYVWTGQHKFQGDPTGNIGDSGATHTVEFGNTGTDRVRFIGEITGVGDAIITDPDGSGTYPVPNSDPCVSLKASLVMNTYTMYDLDTLVFSQGESTQTPAPLNNWVWIEADTGTGSSPVLTGMKYNVPSGKTHQFAVDGTNVVTIDSTGIVGGLGVQIDADPTWTGKHVWDNDETWLHTYTTDSLKDTHCHVKFQGDGLEHPQDSNYDYTDYDNHPAQRVATFGKYGTHQVKFIAEITGSGDAVITDPDGAGTYTIPNSDPAISMKTALVMNTFSIYDLDQIVFGQQASTTSPPMLNNWVGIQANTGEDTTGGSSPPNPVLNGMSLHVPDDKKFFFKIGKGTAGEEAEGSNVQEVFKVSETGIEIAGSSVPSSLANGMIWHNSTDNKVYARSNGVSVELGSGSGGGSDNLGDHTATTTLNMNGQDITGLDDITFSSGATITSDSTKLEFQVPTGDYWMFKIGSGNKFYISETLFRIYTELDMNNQKIIKVANPLASSSTFVNDVPNMGSLTGSSPAYTMHTSHLGSGTANNTKFLRGDSSWATVNATVDQTADYTWTGDHIFRDTTSSGTPVKFQGNNANTAQTVAEIGSYGTHSVKFIAEITGSGNAVISDPDGNGTMTIPNSDPSISVKAGIVMNTYTMYDLDTLVFSQSASSTTPAPENDWVWIEANTGTGSSPSMNGMHYNVPSGKTHQFKINGTEELRIGSNGITFSTNSSNSSNGSLWYDGSNLKARTSSGGLFTVGSGSGGSTSFSGFSADANLNMNSKDIYSIDELKFTGSGGSYSSSDYAISTISGSMIYNAPNNAGHIMQVDGTGTILYATQYSVSLSKPLIMSNNRITVGSSYVEFNDTTSSNIGTPTSNNIRLFCDQNNNDHMSIKRGSTVVDLESSGSSGADTSLSNLSASGESHFDSRYSTSSHNHDSRYLNDSGTQTKSGTTTFTGETKFSGYVNFTGHTTDAYNMVDSLYTTGYIQIKTSSGTKRLYYYAG